MNKHIPPYHPGTGDEAHRLTTWQDLQDLRKELESLFDARKEEQAQWIQRIQTRLDEIDKHLSGIEETLDDVKNLLLANFT